MEATSVVDVLFIYFIFIFFTRLIVVYFTGHKIQPLQVYNSMIFSNFTEWHNHHHKSVLEHFHPLERSHVPFTVNPHSHPNPRQPLTYFLNLNLQGYVLKAKKCPFIKIITEKVGNLGTRWSRLSWEAPDSSGLCAPRSIPGQLTPSPLSLSVAGVLLFPQSPACSSGCSAALGFENTFGCGFSGWAVMD